MRINPEEAGAMPERPEAGATESAEEAKGFEGMAELHAEEMKVEDEFVKAQMRSLELSDALRKKTAELVEASGKSDFKAVEAAAGDIAGISADIDANAKAVKELGDRLTELKRMTDPDVEVTPEEAAAVEENLEGHESEVEQSLRELQEIERQRVAEEAEAKADFAKIEGADVDAAIDAIRTDIPEDGSPERPILLTPDMKKPKKDEVAESLAELQEIERQRVAEEAEAKKRAAEMPEEIEIDVSDLEVEDEGPTEAGEWLEVTDDDLIEAHPSFGEPLMDKWMAEGDSGEFAEKELELGPPSTQEVRDALSEGKLSPERRKLVEEGLMRERNEVFDIVNGAEHRTEKGEWVVKPGLLELEKKLADMKIDMEKMAVSPWERTKVGILGIFSRDVRRTVDEYRKRVDEYNDAVERMQTTELLLKDPKKYAAMMSRRLMRAVAARARAKARSAQKPPGGLFTLKF